MAARGIEHWFGKFLGRSLSVGRLLSTIQRRLHSFAVFGKTPARLRRPDGVENLGAINC